MIMTRRRRLALSLLAFAALASGAGAETLLIDRAAEKPSQAFPLPGQHMTEVRTRFGEPSQKLDPRGGQKRQWPTINRWVYPAFTVYFEKQRVIDVVANQASAEEIGPKPR
ncbi:MAG: hypothetical protein QM581_03070 [Pseudomonas sp.]